MPRSRSSVGSNSPGTPSGPISRNSAHDFPSADLVEQFTVINIGGNKYRLILEIFFDDHVVLVRHVLTHADYDKGKWKG